MLLVLTHLNDASLAAFHLAVMTDIILRMMHSHTRRGHLKLGNNTKTLLTIVAVSYSFGYPEKLLYLLLLTEMNGNHNLWSLTFNLYLDRLCFSLYVSKVTFNLVLHW